MAIEKKKHAHLWERDPHDWYVEPPECSLALFRNEDFDGPVWDPACGRGNIVQSAIQAGLVATGSDIVSRGNQSINEFDFLNDIPSFVVKNIVTNPPFKHAEEFYKRGIETVPDGGKLAMLLPMVWLSGFSSKRDWLPSSPLTKYYAISPRPSMPPGAVIEAGVKPGNGTKDFAWFVWQKSSTCQPQVGFLNLNNHKKEVKEYESSEFSRYKIG